MPIIVTCRECGKQYRMRDDLAGRSLPCKECGAAMRVPNGSRPVPAKVVAPRMIEEEPESGGSALMWIIGGVSALLVIAGIGLTIFLVTRDGDGDDGNRKKDKNETVAQIDDEKSGPDGNLDGRGGGGIIPPERHGKPRVKPRFPEKRPGNVPGGLQPPPENKRAPVFGGNNNPGNINQPGGLIPPKQNEKPVFGDSRSFAWQMQVDAPKEPIEFKTTGQFNLPSPKSTWANALFPESNSLFVALGTNFDEKDFRQVYDLRTKQKVGRIGGIKLSFGKEHALSPDGMHFIARTREIGGIWVYDVKAEKPLGTLPLDEKLKKAFGLEIFGFAGPEHIVAAGRDTPLWVWKAPYTAAPKSITLPKTWDFEKASVTFSPSGRYLVYYHKKQKEIVAMELDTGRTVGRIALPNDMKSHGCKGMAFSPDGQELAALFEYIGKHRLIAWNVADGKQIAQHEFQKKGNQYTGPAIQWFSDKSKWLVFGNDVIDRKEGGPVWSVPKIPNAKSRAQARLVGDRIAIFGEAGREKGLGVVQLPLEEIAKATKVVQAGGTTADVNLPPIKVADWAAARVVAVDGVAGGWKYQPDPAPKAAQPFSGSLSVSSDFGSVMGVRLSSAAANRAVVISSRSSGRRRFGRRREQVKPGDDVVRLDLYDLAGKNKIASLPLTYDCDLQSISPSGRFALVRVKNGEDRIDVWSLDEKKHVVGFRPYQTEKKESERKIRAAVFVDDDHVMTVSTGSRLALWKIPECKAVYVMNAVSDPGLSGSNKYLLVRTARTYRLFEALTGEAVGDLKTNGSIRCAAFHPDGTRFAVLQTGPMGDSIATFDLKTGQMENEFPLPRITYGLWMQWCDDNYLLLGGKRLVDLQSKMIVWSYDLTGGLFAPRSPDQRVFYLSNSQPITLTAATLPHAAAKTALAGKKLEPKMILKPGMKVSLNIQLNGVGGDPNLGADVQKLWTERFRSNGIEVVQNAPLVLFARATTQQTGKSKTFSIRSFGSINERKETVSETVVECRTVFGMNNVAYGERKRKISNLPSFLFHRLLKKGETVASHLNGQLNSSVSGFFRGYSPPAYLFADGAQNGLGSSQLVSGGVR